MLSEKRPAPPGILSLHPLLPTSLTFLPPLIVFSVYWLRQNTLHVAHVIHAHWMLPCAWEGIV